jgi:hypothetical protein
METTSSSEKSVAFTYGHSIISQKNGLSSALLYKPQILPRKYFNYSIYIKFYKDTSGMKKCNLYTGIG